jgi:hypothetical protein
VSGHRDGAAPPGLQYDARHEPHGHPTPLVSWFGYCGTKDHLIWSYRLHARVTALQAAQIDTRFWPVRDRMHFRQWSNCDPVAARSVIHLAASRLALRAPALRAALTRSNGSARWLPCGRNGVPTAVTVGPNDVVANHGVEHGDHLTHHRHDHDLWQFAGDLEAIVESVREEIRECRRQPNSSLP